MKDWISKHIKEEEIAVIKNKTNNKVKEKQYKILNKYIDINILLKKRKLKDVEMFTFCVDGRGNVTHLL